MMDGLTTGKSPRAKAREPKRFQETALQNLNRVLSQPHCRAERDLPPADHPRIRRSIASTHQTHFKNQHSTIINLKSKNGQPLPKIPTTSSGPIYDPIAGIPTIL